MQPMNSYSENAEFIYIKCKQILDNQLEKKISILNLPVPLKEHYDKEKKLIELFNRVPVEKQEIVLQMLRAVLDNIP
mgnify:CR=1 FL=1